MKDSTNAGAIDLDRIKGLKGKPPRLSWLFAMLPFVIGAYSVVKHHWTEWLQFGAVSFAVLVVTHSWVMYALKSSGKIAATMRTMALVVLPVTTIVGLLFAGIGLAINDVIQATLLNSDSSSLLRAICASVMVLLLAKYLYGLRHWLRSTFGSVEILGAVAVVWLTADLGPKAAPSVPLFLLGLTSGAFLVVQGVKNIQAACIGKDDLLAALMMDSFPAHNDEHEPQEDAQPQAQAAAHAHAQAQPQPQAQAQAPGQPQTQGDAERQRQLLAEIAAQRVLLVATDAMVASYEKFAGWLVTGLAAVAALIVANHDQVVKATNEFIPKQVVWLFLWAAAAHAFQRLANTFVQAANGAAREGARLDTDLFQHPGILPRMLVAVAESYPWPLRYLMRYMFAKVARGEMLFIPRVVLRASILGVTLLLVQIGIAIAIIWKIAAAL